MKAILYLITFGLINTVITSPGGLLSIQIEYVNMESLKADGKKCDWIFSSCDVTIKVTLSKIGDYSPFTEQIIDQKTTKTKINAQSFQETVTMNLNSPLPKTYKMVLKFYDEDYYENELISEARGYFEIGVRDQFQSVPLMYQRISSSFSLTSKVKLTCNQNYFGQYCNIYCNQSSNTYTCDTKGNKVCIKSRTGFDCELLDYCYFSPCPRNAVCKNLPREGKRICICENHKYPECDHVIYRCSELSCKNGGKCSEDKTGGSFCTCPKFWTGKYCTKYIPGCSVPISQDKWDSDLKGFKDLCQNGGTCIIDFSGNFSKCKCPSQWNGTFCQRKFISKKTIMGIIFGTIFCLIILVGIFILIIYFRFPSLLTIFQSKAQTILNLCPFKTNKHDNRIYFGRNNFEQSKISITNDIYCEFYSQTKCKTIPNNCCQDLQLFSDEIPNNNENNSDPLADDDDDDDLFNNLKSYDKQQTQDRI